MPASRSAATPIRQCFLLGTESMFGAGSALSLDSAYVELALASRLSPLASRLSPLASRLSPLASRLSKKTELERSDWR